MFVRARVLGLRVERLRVGVSLMKHTGPMLTCHVLAGARAQAVNPCGCVAFAFVALYAF